MNLEHYIEELKTLVNVDCGTHTIVGVATVAGIMQQFWQREGWHTKQISLGDDVGPGVFVSNKPHAEQFDVLLVGHLSSTGSDHAAF
jgi:glutamate carboxypeptidase